MKTYALIILKPDALEAGLAEPIIRRFFEEGFRIEMIGYKSVDETLILTHYAHVVEKLGESFKKMAVAAFVGKVMVPIVLSQDGENAIANSRTLTGATDPAKAAPGTIRGNLGTDSFENADREGRCCYNLIHCSDSSESLLAELKLWFEPETYELFAPKFT
ncbi:MAG: nucleoside-diphosphate kinase [Firmicutes bacterium HGW-Firmicutes-4]|jgi:nucleoside-diphosphate kinase|nr:MAG: nucleoside-diphosphate kinase [Firmicutes bacterium HGW-Firmicutes-4]